MSPELETLDQLQGGNMPIAQVRWLFDDRDRFERAIVAMLDAGEVRLIEGNGSEAPRWRWRQLLADGPAATLSITVAGARRIG